MNKLALSLLTVPLLITFSELSQAVTVYQCEDAQGNKTFQDRCPPGTSQVNAKNYSNTKSTRDSAAGFSGPVTIYRVSECDGCDQVKEFMSVRGISVDEKDINDNLIHQNELQEKTGELKVPTVIIGDESIVGYNRGKLLSALSKLGYADNKDEDQQASGN